MEFVLLLCISVDGLCPEEGFKGVWVSRCMLSLVLGGLDLRGLLTLAAGSFL